MYNKENLIKKALASLSDPKERERIIDIWRKRRRGSTDQTPSSSFNIINKINNENPGQDTVLASKNLNLKCTIKNSPADKNLLIQDSLNKNTVKSKDQVRNWERTLRNNKNRLLSRQLTEIGNTKPDQVSISAKNLAKKSRPFKNLSQNSLSSAKKPGQFSTVQRNDQAKNLETKNKTLKIEINKNTPYPVLALSPTKSGQVSTFDNNTKTLEDYAGKINNDTYLSLRLNIDYLSADISALNTMDSDYINNLLSPIKNSIKQLESANIEQKLQALEKINCCLTNIPLNIYNLGSRFKLMEETQVVIVNKKPNEELINLKSFLEDISMDSLIDYSKSNLIKQSLIKLLLFQDSL